LRAKADFRLPQPIRDKRIRRDGVLLGAMVLRRPRSKWNLVILI
jgi:hypothetical protein